ncbi:MAG: AMP-binding protein [Verrucomicrobiota bacterium]
MGALDIDSGRFWAGEEAAVMRNPRAGGEGDGLESWVGGEDWLKGHVLFRTSGSSGAPKWVALSRSAILCSARAVNAHLEVTDVDRWVRAVPTFHVGGMGMHARAWLGGNEVVVVEGGWDAGGFVRSCGERGGTLSALVPAQVYDLVAEGYRAPESLRAVLVGGGALGARVYEEAVALGWPVVRTYGMSEAASQVATERVGGENESGDWLPVLGHWDVRLDGKGNLSLRGESLLTAYVVRGEFGAWVRRDVLVDGWLRSDDRVELREGRDRGKELRFVDREGDVVKVLGELVSVGKIRERVRARWRGLEVIGLKDDRLGTRLVLVHGADVAEGEAEACFRSVNEGLAGYERLQEVFEVEEVPRTEVGKVDWVRLRGMLAG